MNGSDYALDKTGDIINFYTNIQSSPKLNRNKTFWDNQTRQYNLNKESVMIINKFLETIRNYWKIHYYKRIFRKKLKPNIEFNNLLNLN